MNVFAIEIAGLNLFQQRFFGM